MSQKRYYREDLSAEQMKVIEAFNALPDTAQQEKIVDILYDALYEHNLKAVLSRRIHVNNARKQSAQSTEIARLRQETLRWMTKTKEALNNEFKKAERRAERRELMKEILMEETVRDYARQIRKLQKLVKSQQNNEEQP